MSKETISNELLTKVIRSRRTINAFESQKPADDIILAAIDVACWAPNHKLTEPWRYYLLGNDSAQRIVDLNAKLVEQTKGELAATKKREKWSQIPGWLVITYAKAPDELRDRENYAAVCCAIQNLSLALWAQGVGMKWTTGPVTRDPGIYEILGIDPEREEIVGLMWYGYPAETPAMKRHPSSEFISRLP